VSRILAQAFRLQKSLPDEIRNTFLHGSSMVELFFLTTLERGSGRRMLLTAQT